MSVEISYTGLNVEAGIISVMALLNDDGTTILNDDGSIIETN